MLSQISTTLPESLNRYATNYERADQITNHVRQMLRGWIASPMVEFDGGGQKRIDTFDTIHHIQELIEVATTQSDKEILEAVSEFKLFHSGKREALNNLKTVFQGYLGSPIVENSDERVEVADTYFELQQLTKDLFAAA